MRGEVARQVEGFRVAWLKASRVVRLIFAGGVLFTVGVLFDALFGGFWPGTLAMVAVFVAGVRLHKRWTGDYAL